jgi:hypothetical protein
MCMCENLEKMVQNMSCLSLNESMYRSQYADLVDDGWCLTSQYWRLSPTSPLKAGFIKLGFRKILCRSM